MKLRYSVVCLVVVGMLVVVALLWRRSSVDWRRIPADGPNAYSISVGKSSVEPLVRANINAFNNRDLAAASEDLALVRPETVNDVIIANNIIDFINANGIELLDETIHLIEDRRGPVDVAI